ncbi:hypothetical protein CHS0354_042852 [Potamilus streckersoni]|uniref:AAA+ ATPase domain-containing protein n=1 Tax=Potamilus streckersoni TaxID=2493646 RepID=A0AAE0T4T7_9BIVA|nr:hypothetical protein CHS0354_042852 [Potamilus streckersoni]
MNCSTFFRTHTLEAALAGDKQGIAVKNNLLHALLTTSSEYASRKLVEDSLHSVEMVLIMLRIKAHIPVLIMGETGCGKTSLIHYLSQICEVSFMVIQIHAGVEDEYILERINQIRREAENNLGNSVWLFLDEINTCNHLGLINDILCHHKCLGKTLPPNLIVMAACNPYKLRSEKKVLTAGLQGKIKTDEMSRLVYRVFPLPETMVDYVWDFGSISEKDEKAYVHSMIKNVFVKNPTMDALLADLLIMSQSIVREIEESESCVSLRDVNRCKLLTKWFQDFLKKKRYGMYTGRDFQIRCMILALAHCYHSRLASAQDRKRYRQGIADVIVHHAIAGYTEDKIQSTITEEQRDILKKMELPTGTAHNTALQENVFVILVCILNRIPIFVVGKPGCSKSLSMQVIRSNLRGKDSKNPLFKLLPQLNCVSFQGSESSTSDGIIKVFEKAQRYQEKNNPEEVLSVVILDEIGLAEISKFNPLKVLHSLLEPEGKQFPDVAVVGISNWALDAAKMNRAIHLSRPEMNEEELYMTGKSISESMEKMQADSDHELKRTRSKTVKAVEMDKELKSLADSYMKYVEKQTFENFHGLRDYYSLVKYIAKILSEMPSQEITDAKKMDVITRGLQRNFGGQQSEFSTLHELFKANLQSLEDHRVPVIDLINENIQDKMARHLMLITSGDAALDILEQQLDKLGRKKITMYGSHFEEDLTDDYNYRILNRIILCMEQGLVLILKDLDSIYGSLYDMLNQNYTMVGEKKNCRVALGPYSNPICQVHDDFRCIVLVDESKIDHADPPFLNRFEKQNLKFTDILLKVEHGIISDLENWVKHLTDIPSKHFEAVDIFPIYGCDMIPSLVHKCLIEIEKDEMVDSTDDECFVELTSLCKQRLLWIMKPEAVLRFGLSKFGTNPKNAKMLNNITKEYLHLPIHKGLKRYLHSEINKENEEKENRRMFMIFTNSNIHTNVQAILSDIRCQVDKLGAFKSEKQLTNRMQHFWSEPDPKLLVLQCKPSDDEAHILLARNVVERTRNEYLKEPATPIKHVCIIMHLDRMKSGSRAVPQINFLTEWKLVMLDSLEEPRMPLTEAVGKSLVDTIEQRRPLSTYIQEQLFWAFTRIQYAPGGRDVHSIDLVIKQIQSSEDFLKILDDSIFRWIEEQQEDIDVKNWQVEVACDTYALYSSSTFSGALENYIAQIINNPLARILFELEKLDALSAFLQEDASADVQSMWKELFNDPKLFSIKNTPNPTEAECFACSNPILQFRLPFFKVLYEKIEVTKSFFQETVQTVKSAAGIEDVHEIPDIIWKELLLHQENMITNEVPELEKITYSKWLDDYQNDFFHVTSYQLAKGLSSQQRAQAMRWCLYGEVELRDIHATAVITKLHAAYWIHFGLFQSELQLLDMCKEVLEEMGGISSFLQNISDDSNTVDSLAFDTNGQEFPDLTEDDEVSIINEIVTDNVVQETDGILDNTSVMEINIGSDMYRYNTAVEKPDDKMQLPNVEMPKNHCQEEKKRCKLLVEQLCKMLFPNDTTLSKYYDVSFWHQWVTSVLAIANQVSMDPSVLHALRLCCDVAVQMVLIQPSEIDRLKQLGSFLQNDLLLDSEEIRALMRDVIKTNKNVHKDNSQRLIAAYCSRCIAANPDTEMISWLMDLISDQSLPDNTMTNLKSPIHHALHTELALDRDVFLKLLETDDSSLEAIMDSPFLSAIDACLQRLSDAEQVDSPFSALLIDILDIDILRERITTNLAEVSATTDPQVQYFLKADKILQSDSFSLRHVTAIAYMRSFMTVLSIYLEDRDYDTSEVQVVMQTVNAVLSQSDERIKSLQVFLLKCLRKEKWIFQLQRICKKLSVHLKCYEEDKWQKDFDLKCVEMSPISYHISKSLAAFTATFDAARDIDSIQTLVQRAMSSTEEMICLNNEVMRHFYMKRLISELNDTEKTRCEIIVNCAKEMKMERRALSVIERFCGTSNFQAEMLQLHEESVPLHKDLASIVGHLIVILTVYGCDAGKPVSLFAKSLLDPVSLSELFLPGMPETVETIYSHIPLACLASEDEGFRVLKVGCMVDLHMSALCKFDREVNCIPCKGYCLQDTSKFEEIAFASRKLSKLSSQVLHILLHGCLLGSLAVGFSSVDDIHTLLDKKIKTEDNVSFLVQAMEIELQFLNSYLGLQQQDTIIFLHHVLHQTKALLCEDQRSMILESERAEWEKEFSKIVDILAADRFATILKLRREQNSMYGLPGDALENLIQEVCKIKLNDRTQMMPSLWRSTVAPSFKSLIAELEQKRGDFPFLWLVLSNLQGIKVLKHIGPILNWHLTCFANVSYTMKKREAEEMIISDFLHKESDGKRRQLIKDKFEQFKQAWDDIMETREILQEFDPEFPMLEHIHSQLQLKHCLYDGTHSTISRVLSTLSQKINALLTDLLIMSQRFVCEIEDSEYCVSLPEMDEKELYMTGKSISESMEKKQTESDHKLQRTRPKTFKAVEMDKELRSLADSYMKYVEKQTFANFHGLRDYYSLVKYVARNLSEVTTQEITDEKKMDVITRGFQRNFGGQQSELSTLHELFKANLQSLEDHRVPVIDLITENIQDKMAQHLMLITSGDAALDIVEQQLDQLGKGRITIYGSKFEEDLTDDYNYRMLNRIIICMEQGLVLILKDLDSIYGSLYDMLNQNYTVVG